MADKRFRNELMYLQVVKQFYHNHNTIKLLELVFKSFYRCMNYNYIFHKDIQCLNIFQNIFEREKFRTITMVDSTVCQFT